MRSDVRRCHVPPLQWSQRVIAIVAATGGGGAFFCCLGIVYCCVQRRRSSAQGDGNAYGKPYGNAAPNSKIPQARP